MEGGWLRADLLALSFRLMNHQHESDLASVSRNSRMTMLKWLLSPLHRLVGGIVNYPFLGWVNCSFVDPTRTTVRHSTFRCPSTVRHSIIKEYANFPSLLLLGEMGNLNGLNGLN